MKLKCNDGIVREFQITQEIKIFGKWDGLNYSVTKCLICNYDWGVHSMKAIKNKLKDHVCKPKVEKK